MIITASEIDRQVKQMQEFAKKLKNDPELAHKILMGTGMYTKSGNL